MRGFAKASPAVFVHQQENAKAACFPGFSAITTFFLYTIVSTEKSCLRLYVQPFFGLVYKLLVPNVMAPAP